MNKKVIKNKNR